MQNRRIQIKEQKKLNAEIHKIKEKLILKIKSIYIDSYEQYTPAVQEGSCLEPLSVLFGCYSVPDSDG